MNLIGLFKDAASIILVVILFYIILSIFIVIIFFGKIFDRRLRHKVVENASREKKNPPEKLGLTHPEQNLVVGEKNKR